jgi:competence protein ComEA
VKQNANTLTKAVAWGLFSCGAGIVSYAQQAAPPQQAQHPQYPELPAGPGKDTLVRICSKCHSPDNVIANGQDRAGWENTITKMAGFGAEGSDEEFTEILNYLEKNFPPATTIHVNQATAEQFESSLGLSTTEAEAIIDYRKKNGDFKTLDDLKKVPNVDAKKLDAKKDRLAF